ncbi:hypothetical protein PAE4_20257 [Bacillus altitudinis]|nr:hypothetical protein PAE4_20257 [Bacillus altitudinis]
MGLKTYKFNNNIYSNLIHIKIYLTYMVMNFGGYEMKNC